MLVDEGSNVCRALPHGKQILFNLVVTIMEEKQCMFAPGEVGGRGPRFARGMTEIFWILGDFLEHLNEGVGGDRQVPSDLHALFGQRSTTHQKKPRLTQEMLTYTMKTLPDVMNCIGKAAGSCS